MLDLSTETGEISSVTGEKAVSRSWHEKVMHTEVHVLITLDFVIICLFTHFVQETEDFLTHVYVEYGHSTQSTTFLNESMNQQQEIKVWIK